MSPLPWFRQNKGVDVSSPTNFNCVVACTETFQSKSLLTLEENVANAEQIARAVNCFPKLVETLTKCESLLTNSDVRHFIGHKMGEEAQLHDCLNDIRQALFMSERQEY